MRARNAFDTLAYANKLKAAGVDPKVAEVQAEANADMLAMLLDDGQGLATKQDVSHLKHELDHKIQIVEASLKQDLKDLETRLTLRLGGIIVGGIAVLTTVMSLLRVVH